VLHHFRPDAPFLDTKALERVADTDIKTLTCWRWRSNSNQRKFWWLKDLLENCFLLLGFLRSGVSLFSSCLELKKTRREVGQQSRPKQIINSKQIGESRVSLQQFQIW